MQKKYSRNGEEVPALKSYLLQAAQLLVDLAERPAQRFCIALVGRRFYAVEEIGSREQEALAFALDTFVAASIGARLL